MAKGLIYVDSDDPALPNRARALWANRSLATGLSVEEIARPILDRHNSQWEIIDNCGQCGYELIAGEEVAHTMNRHVSARARSVARDLALLSPELRAEVIALFDANGNWVGV